MINNLLFDRVLRFYRENGLLKTAGRLWERGRQKLLPGRSVIYCCEIGNFDDTVFKSFEGITVESINNQEMIGPDDLNRMIVQVGEMILINQFEERFDLDATLWILKIKGEMGGFFWTIRKVPIEHFFFPLSRDDVYFFDGVIFQEYRGSSMMPNFLNLVTGELKKLGLKRGYICFDDWNIPMSKVASKSPFFKFGVARKFHLFGRDVVIWNEMTNRIVVK